MYNCVFEIDLSMIFSSHRSIKIENNDTSNEKHCFNVIEKEKC